jgi:hypothetical protein
LLICGAKIQLVFDFAAHFERKKNKKTYFFEPQGLSCKHWGKKMMFFLPYGESGLISNSHF